MSKYYTPEIEEFHVGFEFESNYALFSRDREWTKCKLDENNTWFIDEWYVDAVPTEFRVKHLDREDIESLGFEFKGRALRSFFEMDCQFDLPDTDSFWCKNLKIELDEKHRTVKIEGYIASACEEEVLFTGKCKNKSELKKVLKMIGYEKG